MLRVAVLILVSLFAELLAAQEQVYIYISYKDVTGTSIRHKLDCHDAKCTVNIQTDERQISLSTSQQQSLLEAFQAEAQQFVIKPDSASSDRLIKVKLRYLTPKQRLTIERRLPADLPADLTEAMLQSIQTYLELDLSKPVLTHVIKSGERSPKSDTLGPAQ